MKQAQFTRNLLATFALAASASLPFAAGAAENSVRPADTNRDNFVSAQERQKHLDKQAKARAKANYAAADANKDGNVTRQEFMDHQGMMWDKHHPEMMKKHAGMKPDMMDIKQFREFSSSLRLRDGRIDPGKVGGM